MADIVHSKHRSLLLRKIGYSAGLEHSRDRICQLADMYSLERQISESGWTAVVTNKYGRDPAAKVHFENFFNVIGVMRREQTRLVALPILDALVILRSFLGSDKSSFDKAIYPILLYVLTLADGELIGNLLHASFENDRYESQLSRFRQSKLEFLYSAYLNEHDRQELHRVIDFLENPKAGQRGRNDRGPFADIRKFQQEDPKDFSVTLSEDWHRKVPGRRQSWAEDFGLWADNQLTSRGREYLDALESLAPSGIDTTDTAILMPTDMEFSANYLSWALGLDQLVDSDALLVKVGALYADDNSGTFAPSTTEAESLIVDIKARFSSNDSRLSRIRKELPFSVLRLVLVGLAAAKGEKCASPRALVENLQRANTSVLIRKSRNSFFSLSVRR